MITLYCPFCDEEHTLDEHQQSVMCEGCQRQLWLVADGEFVDGHWRDRSKLTSYDLDRTEATCDFYDNLRDEGRSDGQGESYSERNQ